MNLKKYFIFLFIILLINKLININVQNSQKTKDSKKNHIIILFTLLKIYDNQSIFQQKSFVSSKQEKNIILHIIIF